MSAELDNSKASPSRFYTWSAANYAKASFAALPEDVASSCVTVTKQKLSVADYPALSLVVVAQVKTWFQNRRAKWRRLKQENPQATKKEEVEGADSHSDQRPESCPTPEQKGKEVSLDGSQYTPSPASQEDLESDISDDSDQEVDIEGAGLKEYYTTGENFHRSTERKKQPPNRLIL
ncbi:hematopoietically-expressed homeobox protein HHEX [Athene cunicularia]|uniref:hematopoietically-expressed homeobox protein HHEX n=1 Tax=Athene cunicularia TaxID=194338 RepID=UPI000EF65153|nr:hematopoietically-expressed homeobox protein HHEX [Athene cunicularia]